MASLYGVIFLGALLSTFLLTPLVRRIAPKIGVLDRPNGRKIHIGEVPLLGGVALFAGMAISISVSCLLIPSVKQLFAHNLREVSVLFFGGTMLCVLGIWDDVRDLNAWVKLQGQLVIVVVAYLGGIRFHFAPGASSLFWVLVNFLVTVFWLTAIINAINLIDGLDGLASGIAVIVSLSLGVISHMNGCAAIGMLAFLIAGSLLGFLPYNWFPARIYLGDCGSMLLGFFLGALTLLGTQEKSSLASLFIASMLFGIPLLDTSLAICRRFMKGHAIFRADGNHIHHRLLRSGLGHSRSVIFLCAGAFVLGIIAFLKSSKLGGLSMEIINILSVLFLGWTTYKLSSQERLGLFNAIRYSNHRRLSPRKKNIRVRKVAETLRKVQDQKLVIKKIMNLAEDIGLDFLRIEMEISKNWNGQSWEWLTWKRKGLEASEPVELGEDRGSSDLIIAATDERCFGVKCRVIIGKQRWKLRRKSEEDHLYASLLAEGIGAFCDQVLPLGGFETSFPVSAPAGSRSTKTNWHWTETTKCKSLSSEAPRYTILTPMRNEVATVERTIRSVLAQTRRPSLWLVLDDGSTDGSRELIARYSEVHPWIRLRCRSDRGHDLVGEGVAKLLNFGLDELKDTPSDYIVKLDADIELPSDYFERMLDFMEANPSIGVGSGHPFTYERGKKFLERHSDYFPSGTARLYRRSCLEEIGRFVNSVGWDTVDLLRMWMRGFGSRVLHDLEYHHIRRMGTRNGYVDGMIRDGRNAYLTGYTLFFFLCRALFNVRYYPYVLRTACLLYGYLQAKWRGLPKIVTEEERLFHAQLQRKRLRKWPIGIGNVEQEGMISLSKGQWRTR